MTPKILIVDDHMENLIVLEEILEDIDVEFVRALSGNEAVAKCIRTNFALILMDVQMPEMDGFESVALIRRDKKNENTPVILISAIYSEEYYRVKGVEAGGVDFISKPVPDELLVGKVRIFLKLYKQRLELEDAIAKSKALAAQAEEIARAKSEFLANMSHELRTPLNSLLILSQVLAANEEGNLTDEQVLCLKTIHSAGQDQLTLINDLLDLAKVEAAKMEIDIRPLELRYLLEDLERMFAPIAMEKGLKFNTELAQSVPERILSDEQRLRQIIRNLLSNAFKFTSSGSVSFKVKRSGPKVSLKRPSLTLENTIAFSVIDTGIGIPEEKFQTIFESFSQVDSSITRRYGGTGLGLTICREFSAFLGGEVQVESTKGRGSTFTLFLPLQVENLDNGDDIFLKSSPQDTDNEENACVPSTTVLKGSHPLKSTSLKASALHIDSTIVASLKGRKILMVEDDMRNVFSLKSLFAQYNMQVVIGCNGKEGLQRLAEHPDVELVLMDIMMPEMDGYTAMRKIRNSQADFNKVPIIALTAKAMKEDLAKCLEDGADTYVTKPANLGELLEKMAELLRDEK